MLRSQGGVLRARLHVQDARLTFAGRTIEVGTYDGSMPGPTWRVEPGDRLEILLENRLGATRGNDKAGKGRPFATSGAAAPAEVLHEVCAVGSKELPEGMAHGPFGHAGPAGPAGAEGSELWTNLHTHGLQVSPRGNSDNPFLRIRPGESCRYEIEIPADQPGGFYWYHPHLHGNTSKQAWAGMSGGIVVEGALDRVPEVRAARERVLLLEELWLDRNGRVPAGVPLPAAGAVPFTSLPATPTDHYLAVNGAYQPRIDIRPGETQRWRIAAAGPHRFFLLELEGHPFHLLARDGVPLARAEKTDRILLAPGNRVEVMVRGGTPGSYRLRALAYDPGHPGGALPERLLATLVSAGRKGAGRLPDRLVPPPPSLAGLPVAARRTLIFNGEIETVPPTFTLNGHAFEMGKVDLKVRAGTVEEWTLRNNDAFHHPFHLHVNPFQVVEVNGRAVPDPLWWDTYPLPPRGEVKVRIRFRPDLDGRTVYHCHILPHEDAGMMGLLEIEPAEAKGDAAKPEREARPRPKTGGRPGANRSREAPRVHAEAEPRGGGRETPKARPSGVVAAQLRPQPGGPLSTTYVFLRAHDGQTQAVAAGSTVEVQLPAGPGAWTLTSSSSSLRPLGPPFPLPDPDGLSGGPRIQIFSFAAGDPGLAALEGVEADPRTGRPLRRYRLTLFVQTGPLDTPANIE